MNKKNLESEDQPKEEAHFSDETMQGLQDLGAVLEPIYRRLIAEGYVIKNGRILKTPDPALHDSI